MAGEDEDDPGRAAYWQRFLQESAAPFEPEQVSPPSLETLRGLYAAVLQNYSYTCAMTGRTFAAPKDLLHDELRITPIRPLPLGGALHVSNFLCLENEADAALRAGHISVGPKLQLIADLSRIDPELLERLSPNGRLRLPVSEVAQPDPASLAFHREHIFLRG